jgi:hypothetical protein
MRPVLRTLKCLSLLSRFRLLLLSALSGRFARPSLFFTTLPAPGKPSLR